MILNALGTIEDLKTYANKFKTDMDNNSIVDWNVFVEHYPDGRQRIGLLSELTTLPAPDYCDYVTIQLEPVYKNKIIRACVPLLVGDMETPQVQAEYFYIGDSAGTGEDAAAFLQNKYANSYPNEFEFAGYDFVKENEDGEEVFYFNPKVSKTVVSMYTQEYKDGETVYTEINQGVVMAPDEIDNLIASAKSKLTPIENGEVFERWDVEKCSPSYFGSLIVEVYFNAKYKDKNVIMPSFAIENRTELIGSELILADENSTADAVITLVKSEANKIAFATELGVTEWNTYPFENKNWSYLTLEPVRKPDRYYVAFLVNYNDGKYDRWETKYVGVNLNDNVPAFPKEIGNVKNINWEWVHLIYQDGQGPSWFRLDEYSPSTVEGDICFIGDGEYVASKPSVTPPADNGSSSGNNNNDNTTDNGDTDNNDGDDDNNDSSASSTPAQETPATEKKPESTPAVVPVPPTSQTPDPITEEAEEQKEETTQSESNTEEVSSKFEFASGNGETIELENISESTKAVLEQVLQNRESVDQKKAEKIASEMEEMPKTNETVSSINKTDSGNAIVTENIKIGTDSLEINAKGEIGLNQSTVNEITNGIAEVLQKNEDSQKDDPDVAHETPEIVLDMGAATVISPEIFDAISDKDVNLVIKKNGYSWTINGNDIAASKPVAINFEVDFDTDAVPEGTVKQLAGNSPTTQLSLAHNGTFGLKATLTVELGELGTNNVGQYGNLYYYDSSGKLVFQNAGKITSDGTVSLEFSHASDYVLVVGKDATPKSINAIPFVVVGILAVIAIAAVAVLFVRRKRSMQDEV